MESKKYLNPFLFLPPPPQLVSKNFYQNLAMGWASAERYQYPTKVILYLVLRILLVMLALLRGNWNTICWVNVFPI